MLRVGGSPESRAALGVPFGRVVLAGEATHPTQAGMVHGAYEQGVAAAQWAIATGADRVVVVGAGAAGAGAARWLVDAGVEVVVLEARRRVGGRVWSTPVGRLTAELGANWLQQGARNTLAPLAAALELRTVPTDFHAPALRGRVPAGLDATATAGVVGALQRRVTTLVDDIPLSELVDEMLASPLPWDAAVVRAVVDGEISLDSGAPLADLSARHGFEAGVGEGDRWVVGGYGQLIDSLLADVDVRLDTVVDAVVWSDTGVVVRAGTVLHPADAVIVSVPAAVLAEGRPDFDPPLPTAHRDALGLLTVGRVEKAVLVFDERWWRPSASGYTRIYGDGVGEVSEWLDLTDALGTPAVTGIFVGDWAARLWSSTADADVAGAVADVFAAACA